MYRSLIAFVTAVVLIIAAAATGSAQSHGFRGSMPFGPATVTRTQTATVRNLPPVVRPGGPIVHPFNPVHTPIGIAPGFHPHPRPLAPVIVTPVIGGFYSPYGYPYYYGYGGPEYYPGGSAYYPYSTAPYPDTSYVAPAVQSPPVTQNDTDLAYQVGRLTQEVEQLRQQQQPQTQATQDHQGVPVVLVFRDGHRMEIQNYAIVGETLWILDQNNSTRIPLSQLDVDATQRENRSRGQRFLVPQK
jgi:hypothetical protein